MKFTLLSLATLTFSLATLTFSLAAQAAPDASKVADALNSLVEGKLFENENGRLKVASSGKNNKDKGFEDCRQLAINHAIIDLAMGGEVGELKSKGSHRISISTLEGETIRGLVGLKVGAAERTYSYLMNDPENGYCKLTANEGSVAGMKKRKAVEKDYLKSVIPSLSEKELVSLKEKHKATNNEQLAAEAVKKLMPGECMADALNLSLAAGSKAFQAKYAAKPISYLMLSNSSLTVAGSKVTGLIKVAMTDEQGTNKMISLTSLSMTEGEEDCTLVSESTEAK